MRVVEVNRYTDFLALEKAWRNILQRCHRHTIFSTWEWLATWWKHFDREKRLLVLLAEEEHRIIGIAPLMYSVHSMLGVRQGKIEFIGNPDSDYGDFILGERNERCIELFISHLENNCEKWHRIELTEIPEDSMNLSYLRRYSKYLKPIHECPYTLLPKSYEEFLMSLSRNQRKNIYRTSRRVAEVFKVDFIDYSDPRLVNEGMQCLFDLHQKRWESRGFKGIFADEKYRAFNLEIARLFSDKKWLCLFVMSLSGKPVAAAYGFKYQSKFYEYITGLDPAYVKYNVGNLLRAHMVSNLIQEGVLKFDFMRGAEEYKDRWNTTVRWNYGAVITRKGSLKNVKYQLYDTYWRQAGRLRYVVKNAPRTLAQALNKRESQLTERSAHACSENG